MTEQDWNPRKEWNEHCQCDLPGELIRWVVRLLTEYDDRGKEIERLNRLRTWDEYPEKLPGGLMLEFDRLDDMWQSLVKELWEAKKKAKCWDELWERGHEEIPKRGEYGIMYALRNVMVELKTKHGVK